MQTSNVDGYSLAIFSGFSDEMQKIAGRFGEAVRTFGHYLAGGPKTDLITEIPLPQHRLSKMLGDKPKLFKAHIPGEGPRVGGGLSAIKNPETREDALKVVGARTAAGAGLVGTGMAASKHHKEHSNQQLEEAYMSGARDMLSQSPGK